MTTKKQIRKVKRVKACPKCKTSKELALFPGDKSRKDGLYPWCRACVSAGWRRRYRDGYKAVHLKKKWMDGDTERMRAYSHRKREKWGVRLRAQQILRNAVKSGTVTKLPCQVCGNSKSQGHHSNYERPLDVLWLCDIHHKEIHGRTITYSLPRPSPARKRK